MTIVYNGTFPGAEVRVMGPGMPSAEPRPGDSIRYSGPATEAVGIQGPPREVSLSGGWSVERVDADGRITVAPSARLTCIVTGSSMVPGGRFLLPPGAQVTILNG